MKDMIRNHYRVRMVLDNMPVTTMNLELVRPGRCCHNLLRSLPL